MPWLASSAMQGRYRQDLLLFWIAGRFRVRPEFNFSVGALGNRDSLNALASGLEGASGRTAVRRLPHYTRSIIPECLTQDGIIIRPDDVHVIYRSVLRCASFGDHRFCIQV